MANARIETRSRLGITSSLLAAQITSRTLLSQQRRGAYYPRMRDATIILGTQYGARSAFCRAAGEELRARRLAARLTQAALADPLTAAYVSAVENGRVVPSLPALLFMLDRLGVSAAIYFEAVNCRLRWL